MAAPHRRSAAAVTVVGALAFIALAVVLVPWDPIPGPTPPTPEARSVFDSAFLDRAEHYSRWARTWSMASLVVSLVVAGGLGFSSLGHRLVERLPGPWWSQVVLAVATLSAIGRLVTLPFGLALLDLRVEEGLSTQSTTAWLGDVARAELVGVVVTSAVLLLLVGSARRWRRRWPAVAGVASGLLVLAVSFVYPVVVEPLFNDFEPLPEGSLRTAILTLADEQGVDVDEVLVADASRRTTTLNAYVSGFGSTRRVVVYDTLVDDLPEDQALSVVAHELTHARHGDVVTGSALGAAGAVTVVGLLGLVVGGGGVARRRMGVSDPAVVPLVLALVVVGSVLVSPVQSGISRRIEARADVDALVATRDPEAFAEMQRRLAERSLADPTPPGWSQVWFGSHPTALERIGVADLFRNGRRPAGHE